MILALVPRDLLHQLPVPKRIRTYLDTPFYYSETMADWTVPGNEPVSSNLSKNEDIETEVEQTSPLHSNTSPREGDQSSNPILREIVDAPTSANQTYQNESCTNDGAVENSETVSKPSICSPQNFQHNHGNHKREQTDDSSNTAREDNASVS